CLFLVARTLEAPHQVTDNCRASSISQRTFNYGKRTAYNSPAKNHRLPSLPQAHPLLPESSQRKTPDVSRA
ncbi:MAG TPA: hypothetical protein VGV68_04260, partial [Terriglobia bacterium]|nr:hypothetical protein [Terriglobia bacterium]